MSIPGAKHASGALKRDDIRLLENMRRPSTPNIQSPWDMLFTAVSSRCSEHGSFISSVELCLEDAF